MAVYSVRLATATTLVGLLFSLAAHQNAWQACVLLTAGLVALSALSITRSVRQWDDPGTRARVVAAVANG
jgi:hypothetical protein